MDSDDESLSSSSGSSSSSSLSSSSSSEDEDEEEEEEGVRAEVESEGPDTMDESTMDSMAVDSEKENERYLLVYSLACCPIGQRFPTRTLLLKAILFNQLLV